MKGKYQPGLACINRRISAWVGASTRFSMKKFHKSQRDPNSSRRVNLGLEKGYPAIRIDLGWLLRSCKYLLQVDRGRVEPLLWVEANLSSCKRGLSLMNYRDIDFNSVLVRELMLLSQRPLLHEPELASTHLRGSTLLQSTCNEYIHDHRSQPWSTLLAG